MIVPLSIPNATETKVVDVSQVEFLSSMGYRLHALFESEHYIQGEQSWVDGQVKYPNARMQTVQMAVMAITHDDPVAALQAECAELREQTRKAQQAQRSSDAKLVKLRETFSAESARLTADVESARRRVTSAEDRERTANQRAQALETDIGKVRTAIGQIKLTEILTPKA